ncbi:hypothetical protein GCM10009678_55440 [Actinomadura kijaniata]|uniref:Uncharacterized protein n=1 Tax=Actinomadura namibiensis TaxID=182080 RepID=A0A7W3LLB8_ACTNM|nr:hypothetical protein [Actinomadura namibiensis]MBA8950239.1 hypothetical protein [Actinomadura namibiensis]
MKRVTSLVVGMVLFVLGVQGGIRLLADRDNAGILDWMPGGFPVRLSSYALMILAGALLAGWGSKKAA